MFRHLIISFISSSIDAFSFQDAEPFHAIPTLAAEFALSAFSASADALTPGALLSASFALIAADARSARFFFYTITLLSLARY